ARRAGRQAARRGSQAQRVVKGKTMKVTALMAVPHSARAAEETACGQRELSTPMGRPTASDEPATNLRRPTNRQAWRARSIAAGAADSVHAATKVSTATAAFQTRLRRPRTLARTPVWLDCVGCGAGCWLLGAGWGWAAAPTARRTSGL